MKYRVWLLISTGIVLILVVSCRPVETSRKNDRASSPAPTRASAPSGLIDIHANSTYYSGMYWIITITNGTSKDIIIPVPGDAQIGEGSFRFYEKTPMGWTRLLPIPGYLTVPIADEPGLLIPAEDEASVDISTIMGSYMPYSSPHLEGEFLVQVRYKWRHGSTDGELVRYSSPFLVRKLPAGGPTQLLGEIDVRITLDHPSSLAFSIENSGGVPIWFPSVCSSICGAWEGTAFGDDGRLALQRQTDEGSWQIVRGDSSNCQLAEPIRVDPGEAVMIDARPWFQGRIDALGPGSYRWDVVFYLEEDVSGEERLLRDVRHVFSEPFEYNQ